MKKFVLATLFVFALSSVAFASPLTDYSKGKAALDINYRVSPDYDASGRVEGIKGASGTLSFDGDSNLEWGFTYGIGNNWALQYRQATPKGTFSYGGYTEENRGETIPTIAGYPVGDNVPAFSLEAKTRVEEYNVLYQLDKNVSLFTGVVRANPSLKVGIPEIALNATIQGEDKNIWQFGVVGSKPLNDNLTAYGLASFGSDYRNWEAGLGYKLCKDVELNVNYRDMKVDNMDVGSLFNLNAKTDTQIKGWGFGVTYNF